MKHIIGLDAKRIVRNATGLGSYGRTLVNDLLRTAFRIQISREILHSIPELRSPTRRLSLFTLHFSGAPSASSVISFAMASSSIMDSAGNFPSASASVA